MKLTNEAHEFYTAYHTTVMGGEHLQGVPKTILPYLVDLCSLAHKHTFNIRQDQPGVFVVEFVPQDGEKVVSDYMDCLLGISGGTWGTWILKFFVLDPRR